MDSSSLVWAVPFVLVTGWFIYKFLWVHSYDPEQVYYLMKSEPFAKDTDHEKVYGDDEVRLYNSQVSVIYYKGDGVEMVDYVAFSAAGGTKFRVQQGKISSMMKDAVMYHASEIPDDFDYWFVQIWQHVLKEVDRLSS